MTPHNASGILPKMDGLVAAQNSTIVCIVEPWLFEVTTSDIESSIKKLPNNQA